jgi:hypothetical protein
LLTWTDRRFASTQHPKFPLKMPIGGQDPTFGSGIKQPVVYLYRRTINVTSLVATYDLLKVLQRLLSFLHGTMQNCVFLIRDYARLSWLIHLQ